MRYSIDYVGETLNVLDGLLPIMANPGRESSMYRTVETMFARIGFQNMNLPLVRTTYQIHKRIANDDTIYTRDTPNLALHFEGSPDKPHLVFNAHLDHYFANGVTKQAIRQGDWLIGDGINILGADCKLGISFVYVLVKHILAEGNPPSIDLIFDTCEEAGLIGAVEFYETKQYSNLPFWNTYKRGKPVFFYCFDGIYEEKMGMEPCAYVNRPSGLSLSKYFMNPTLEKVCDVTGDKIKWRKWTKKEKLLTEMLCAIGCLDIDRVKVEKYGTSMIFLSKIIPAVLLPMPVLDYHTPKERVYVPYLNTLASFFTRGKIAPESWESRGGLMPLNRD